MAAQMQAVRIASLNINGATAASKLDMLTDFLHRQEITIILLQEVTHVWQESVAMALILI
jgi:exonuclease III